MKYDYLKVKDLDSMNIKLLNCSQIQCYSPILENIFQINENNYNKVILKSKFAIKSFISKTSYNHFRCNLETDSESKECDAFIKYAALFDPVKYGMNKIDNLKDIENLPSFNDSISHDYIKDRNNTSYIDGMFTYLSSRLLNDFDFIHGIQFYGSFLGLKEDFKYNLYEELETVLDSKEFLNNRDKKFTVDSCFNSLMTESTESNKEKKPLVIQTVDCSDVVVDKLVLDTPPIEFLSNQQITLDEYVLDKFDEEFKFKKSVESESISSASSDTTMEDDNKENTDGDGDGDGDGDDTSSGEDDEDDEDEDDTSDDEDGETPEINMYIKNFPVNVIVMESLSHTLDELMSNEEMEKENWASMLMQVIFILITYQDIFSFTHNDLHTSNIMYKTTDKEYLYYCYDGIYYKVPTYGKIWKIIDFGRSIYNVNSTTFFSNSFSKDGDAHSQYNVEPYFNKESSIVKPNSSFDLCRLACSLFDYFFDSIDDVDDPENDEIQNLVKEWCTDYKQRNVLYKKNGEERYPDFKLYKMIARDVKDHTPHNQLNKKIFSDFIIPNKKAKNKKMLNIDVMKTTLNKTDAD